jgi:hypothetical protein
MYDGYLMSPTDSVDSLELSDDMEYFEGFLDDSDGEFGEWIVNDAALFGESFDSGVELGEVLRDVLHEDYEDSSLDELDEALFNIFDSLSPTESLSLGNALNQIAKGAGRAAGDPRVGQFAAAGLPILGGAVGTYFGGPPGMAAGASLGSAAARALPKSGKPAAAEKKSAPSVGQAPVGTPPVTGGSSAAAQGLVLTQQPEVLKSLLALALGAQGRSTVDGVPVGAVMSLLSTIFGQAAADADELVYASEEMSPDPPPVEAYPFRDATAPLDRAQVLYEELLGVGTAEPSLTPGWQ